MYNTPVKILLNKILNKKQQTNNILIGTVSSLTPFKVTLFPGDTAIPAVQTTNLLGVQVGSRVLLQLFLNQYIAVAVIGTPSVTNMVLKTSSETVNNSTVLQNDDQLAVTIPADGYYYSVEAYIIVDSANSAQNFKCTWSRSSTSYSSGSLRWCLGVNGDANTSVAGDVAKASYFGYDTEVSYPVTDTGNETCIYERFVVKCTTSTPVTFQLKWAQATAGAYNTVLSSGSYIILTKLLSI